jgi:hypothetical protein
LGFIVLGNDEGGIMANQTINLGYEREWERRRALQEAAVPPLTAITPDEADRTTERRVSVLSVTSPQLA